MWNNLDFATGVAIGGVFFSALTWWTMRRGSSSTAIRAIQAQVHEASDCQGKAATAVRALKPFQATPRSPEAVTAWLHATQAFFVWAQRINLIAETAEYTDIPRRYFRDEILPYLRDSLGTFLDFAHLLQAWPLSQERGFLKSVKTGDFRNLLRVVLGSLSEPELGAFRTRIENAGLGNALLAQSSTSLTLDRIEVPATTSP